MDDYLAGHCGNVFEAVARARSPRLDAAMRWLETHGEARLSGSGSACFIAVDSHAQALALRAAGPEGLRMVVARGCNASPLRARLASSASMER